MQSWGASSTHRSNKDVAFGDLGFHERLEFGGACKSQQVCAGGRLVYKLGNVSNEEPTREFVAAEVAGSHCSKLTNLRWDTTCACFT